MLTSRFFILKFKLVSNEREFILIVLSVVVETLYDLFYANHFLCLHCLLSACKPKR